jgi:hypothetical protein
MILQEFNFDATFQHSPKEEFPPSEGGALVFKRSELVKRMVDNFETRYTADLKYKNFYFRHSAGNGKTVLLKLFGKELQQRGFVVYMLTAPSLDNYNLQNLVEKLRKDGKQVAILVDEVHRNVNACLWDYLLKKAPSNLLVIGTGISELVNESPQFLVKYPSYRTPPIGPFTEEDLPEVLAHFVPKGDPLCEVKTKALKDLLVATGGQA